MYYWSCNGTPFISHSTSIIHLCRTLFQPRLIIIFSVVAISYWDTTNYEIFSQQDHWFYRNLDSLTSLEKSNLWLQLQISITGSVFRNDFGSNFQMFWSSFLCLLATGVGCYAALNVKNFSSLGIFQCFREKSSIINIEGWDIPISKTFLSKLIDDGSNERVL